MKILGSSGRHWLFILRIFSPRPKTKVMIGCKISINPPYSGIKFYIPKFQPEGQFPPPDVYVGIKWKVSSSVVFHNKTIEFLSLLLRWMVIRSAVLFLLAHWWPSMAPSAELFVNFGKCFNASLHRRAAFEIPLRNKSPLERSCRECCVYRRKRKGGEWNPYQICISPYRKY